MYSEQEEIFLSPEYKILLVSAFFIDFSYGSEPTTGMNLLVESLKNFPKVILLTSSNTKPETLAKLKRVYANQIEIHIVKVSFQSRITNTFLFYPLYRNWQKKVGNLLAAGTIEYDLGLHATLGTFLFGCGLSKGRKPYIFGPAGFSYFKLKYFRVIGLKSIKEIFRNLAIAALLVCDPFVRKSLRKATLTLATDFSVIKTLIRTANSKSLFRQPVAHVIVPTQQIENSLDIKRKNSIVWVGRFIPRKDPIFALEVFNKLVKQNPWLELTMIGEGSLEGKIRNYIVKNRLEMNVKLVGWIPKSEVMDLMREANYMFFTSYRESAGLQIFECVNTGTRVISLDATGASDWFHNSLVRYVSPTFGQSRGRLVEQFCQVYKTFNSSETIPVTLIEDRSHSQLNFDFSAKALFRNIFTILSDHES